MAIAKFVVINILASALIIAIGHTLSYFLG